MHRTLAALLLLATTFCFCDLTAAPGTQRRGMGTTPSRGGSVPTMGPGQGPTVKVEHAVTGEMASVDVPGHSVVVHTPEGAGQIVGFTGQTAVRGVADVRLMSDAGAATALGGATVLVRFTSTGFDVDALSVELLGHQPMTVLKGNIVRLDETGTSIVMRTPEGREVTGSFAAHAVLDGPKGVRDATAQTVRSLKAGSFVTTYYVDDGGKTLIYLLKYT